LIAVKRTGGPIDMLAGRFDPTFSLQALFNATAVAVKTATLSGTPVPGDVWTATVNQQALSVTVGETINSVVVDTPSEIAQALADKINSEPSLSDVIAAVETGVTATLIIVNRAGGALVTSFAAPLTHTVELIADTAAVASARVATLNGLQVAGTLWRAMVGSTVFIHLVTEGETLAQSAEALAEAINASAATADFTATTEETSLIVIERSAGAFTLEVGQWLPSGAPLTGTDLTSVTGLITALSTGAANSLSAFLWSTIPASTQTQLQDATVNLETKKSLLVEALNTVIEGGTSIYTTERFTGITLSATTQALNTLVPTGPGLVRLNRMLLEDAYPTQIMRSPITVATVLNATAQTATNNVQPVPNDVWHVVLTAQGQTSLHTYTVHNGDQAVDVVKALAANINNNANDAFTATTEGATLLIVNRNSAQFELANNAVSSQITKTTLVWTSMRRSRL